MAQSRFKRGQDPVDLKMSWSVDLEAQVWVGNIPGAFSEDDALGELEAYGIRPFKLVMRSSSGSLGTLSKSGASLPAVLLVTTCAITSKHVLNAQNIQAICFGTHFVSSVACVHDL